MLKKLLLSKKIVVSFVSLVVAILAANGVVVPEGMEGQIAALVIALAGLFNIGQGLADGLSNGATSAGKE